MENYKVTVDSRHMLSIFSGVDIRQPYRFQPYVELTIPYKEYRNFVQRMVDLVLSWLSFDKSLYIKALGDERLMYRLYCFDVSKAVVSEVILSDICRKKGTIIRHFFEDAAALSGRERWADVPEGIRAKAIKSFERDVSGRLDVSVLTGHNLLLFQYALFLRVHCYTENQVKFNTKNGGIV